MYKQLQTKCIKNHNKMYKQPQQNVTTQPKRTIKCINNLNKMYKQPKQNVYNT